MEEDLSIPTATKAWRSALLIFQIVLTSLCATLALGGLVFLFLSAGPSDDPFRQYPWLFYLLRNDKQGTLILLGCIATLCSVIWISRHPGHLWDQEPGLVTGLRRFGMWVRGLRMRQVTPVLIGLLSVSGILAAFVVFFRGVEFGKNDFEGSLQFAFALGVLVWAVNILHSKWQSPDFVREVRRPLCTCTLSFIFILFPSWWTGVPLALLIFIQSKWGTPEFAWEIGEFLGFLVLVFLVTRFPSWWTVVPLWILIIILPHARKHYLYPKWKIAWSVLEEIVLGRCYDCRRQEDERRRQVLICVPVSEEERNRRVKEYCKEHFGDVSEDTQSEPEKREHRWIQEHPYPKKFVLNPYKSLLVLKSKKGFGVWNTEINAQYQQVSFQKDTVVVQCAFLNPDGSLMSQECEYRIPWKTGTAPQSGLLRKSGEILIRPYDSQSAFPEYVPADSPPVAE